MANTVENGTLYVVATPIGNLGDITYRAVKILKCVDVIASEDTRNTSILLEKYDIKTKLISYHKFSEAKRTELFLNYLKEGKSVALVSDAGTPLISDPGNILVDYAYKNGFKIVPISGACAAITLLSATSRNDEDFKFIGFLPRNENQIINVIVKNNLENLVFYESPNRLIKTLETITKIYPDKIVTVARELTKKFEEIKKDNLKNIIEYYKTKPIKGEIAVLLHKSEENKETNLKEKIQKLQKLNLKDKEISSIISSLYEINKNDVYKICLELKTI